MILSTLLTALAVGGVIAGVCAGRTRHFSAHLVAAGAGLLFGIALFWLFPEIAQLSGTAAAALLVAFIAAVLTVADHFILHAARPGKPNLIGPLLVATSVHSFLDGWSLRAITGVPVATAAAFLGLAIHKLPEGLALGWIARRSLNSVHKALLVSAGIEFLTFVGAAVEPLADRSVLSALGAWWSALVLAIIAGSFSFLSVHAMLPLLRRPSVLASFAATSVAIGCLTLWR